MKIKIAEIHFRDPKIEEYAIKKASKLEKFHSGLELIRISLTKERNHLSADHTFFCELQFDIAGKNFVLKDSEKDYNKAIVKAVERAKNALVRHKEKEISKKHKAGIKIKIEERP